MSERANTRGLSWALPRLLICCCGVVGACSDDGIAPPSFGLEHAASLEPGTAAVEAIILMDNTPLITDVWLQPEMGLLPCEGFSVCAIASDLDDDDIGTWIGLYDQAGVRMAEAGPTFVQSGQAFCIPAAVEAPGDFRAEVLAWNPQQMELGIAPEAFNLSFHAYQTSSAEHLCYRESASTGVYDLAAVPFAVTGDCGDGSTGQTLDQLVELLGAADVLVNPGDAVDVVVHPLSDQSTSLSAVAVQDPDICGLGAGAPATPCDFVPRFLLRMALDAGSATELRVLGTIQATGAASDFVLQFLSEPAGGLYRLDPSTAEPLVEATLGPDGSVETVLPAYHEWLEAVAEVGAGERLTLRTAPARWVRWRIGDATGSGCTNVAEAQFNAAPSSWAYEYDLGCSQTIPVDRLCMLRRTDPDVPACAALCP